MRIAIVGAGPTGFFLAASLLKSGPEELQVDMFEKTPFPFGLVRFGVAPDHPKIKSVTKGFQKTMDHPRFSFFGNTTLAEQGKPGDITFDDLQKHYHRVVLTVGCQDDRKLGIPREESHNSFSATRFVGWYNGHPEDVNLNPDLKVTNATVVGAGNVAIDVVRFLASSHERMAVTDASDHSLESLKTSTIKEIDILVRRGAWDVAFTNPEVKELLDFEDIQFSFSPDLPPLETPPPYADRRSTRNLEVFHELAKRTVESPRLKVNFRFQVSPTELRVDENDRLKEVEVCHNSLEFGETRSSIKATDQKSTYPTQLFIRSVGYRGRALEGIPFNDSWGLVPCDDVGRVTDMEKNVVPGLYVSGWMRRGPSGVIGTNKKDAQEVGTTLLGDDVTKDVTNSSEFEAFRQSLASGGSLSKTDWTNLDAWETSQGEAAGKPRRKLVTIEQVRQALSQKETSVAG